MRGEVLLARRATSNLAAVKMDLAAASADDDTDRVKLLETSSSRSGGPDPAVPAATAALPLLLGDIESAAHVAVVVPGVGDGTNLCEDWIPDARNLYEAARDDTAVVLWKGYDNPVDVLAAAAGSIECNEDLPGGGR